MHRISWLMGVVCLAPVVLAGDGPGWVVIPVTEYQALRGKAQPAEHSPEAPVEATLTKVDYDLKVEGALASGRALLTVDVVKAVDIVKDGWVRVPIPQGLLVREARIDGRSVALSQVAGRGLAAVLSKPGRSVLILDLAFPVSSSGGEERLSLPAGSSGVTRASIHLPGQDLDVRVAGGFLAEKTPTHWLAFAKGTEPLLLSWRKRIEERRVELPLRLRGSLVQLFGLGEDSTTVSGEVQVEVLQGAARQVRIAIPAAVTINQVPGATVADWDVKNGELIVNFLEPVERSARFVIQGESRLAREGAISIPLLRLLDAERDTGGVAVEVLGAGEIKETKPVGLEGVEAADLGPTVASRQSPSLAAFRIRPGSGSRELSVQVARYAQQAVLTANIEEARYRVLASADGKVLVQARYAVRNNQRSFLRLTLAPDAAVWSSSVDGRAVRAGMGPDGSLLLPLTKSRAGEDAPVFAVELVYLARAVAWEAKGRAPLPLPAVDLPVSRTGVMLYYPPGYRVTLEPGAFRAQEFAAPQSEVLNASGAAAILSGAANVDARVSASTQALVDSYNARTAARRRTDAVPVGLSFPAVGPSLFLVTELTGENRAGGIILQYQKDKKGGQ